MPTGAAAALHVTVRCQWCESWNRVDAARFADRPKCGTCSKPMLLDRPLKLDDATFARTIAESELPVVVDFHADWCAPCKAMAPAVDEVARELSGRVLVTKLDTDRAPATGQQFRITSLPTVARFSGGVEVERLSGAMPLAALRAFALG